MSTNMNTSVKHVGGVVLYKMQSETLYRLGFTKDARVCGKYSVWYI